MSADFDKAQADYDAREPEDKWLDELGQHPDDDRDDEDFEADGRWDFDPDGLTYMPVPLSTFPGDQPDPIPGQLDLDERIAEASRRGSDLEPTAVCADGLHHLCSTRLCTNPSDGWHNARYVPCPCECHAHA